MTVPMPAGEVTRGVGSCATDAATAFYADLLGAPPVARFDPPGLVFFDLVGTRLLRD